MSPGPSSSDQRELEELKDRFLKYVNHVRQSKEDATSNAGNVYQSVTHLEQEVMSLKRSYETQLAQLKASYGLVVKENSDLMKECETKRHSEQHLLNRLTVEASTNHKLIDEVSALKSELMEKDQKLRHANTSFNKASLEATEFETKYSQAQRELNELTKQLQNSGDLRSLKAESSSASWKECNEYTVDDILALRNQLEAETKKCRHYQEENEHLLNDILECRNTGTKFEAQIRSLEEQVEMLERNIRVERSQSGRHVTSLEERLRDVEESLEGRSREMEGMKENNRAYRREIEALKAIVEEEENRLHLDHSTMIPSSHHVHFQEDLESHQFPNTSTTSISVNNHCDVNREDAQAPGLYRSSGVPNLSFRSEEACEEEENVNRNFYRGNSNTRQECSQQNDYPPPSSNHCRPNSSKPPPSRTPASGDSVGNISFPLPLYQEENSYGKENLTTGAVGDSSNCQPPPGQHFDYNTPYYNSFNGTQSLSEFHNGPSRGINAHAGLIHGIPSPRPHTTVGPLPQNHGINHDAFSQPYYPVARISSAPVHRQSHTCIPSDSSSKKLAFQSPDVQSNSNNSNKSSFVIGGNTGTTSVHRGSSVKVRAQSASCISTRTRGGSIERHNIGQITDYFEDMFGKHEEEEEDGRVVIKESLHCGQKYFNSSAIGDVKFQEIEENGKYVRLVNSNKEKDVEFGGYMLQQNIGGHAVAMFRFPPRVRVPAGDVITVWAGCAMSEDPGDLANRRPSDYFWPEYYRWKTKPECTTILCQANGQAVAWSTPTHRVARSANPSARHSPMPSFDPRSAEDSANKDESRTEIPTESTNSSNHNGSSQMSNGRENLIALNQTSHQYTDQSPHSPQAAPVARPDHSTTVLAIRGKAHPATQRPVTAHHKLASSDSGLGDSAQMIITRHISAPPGPRTINKPPGTSGRVFRYFPNSQKRSYSIGNRTPEVIIRAGSEPPTSFHKPHVRLQLGINQIQSIQNRSGQPIPLPHPPNHHPNSS